PERGARLLNHLSCSNAGRGGVQIRGEAALQDEHTLYLIVEAKDEFGLRAFLEPFESAGSVEIYPASTCAAVVTRGGCDAPPPASDALNPAEACQQAIDGGLVVHRAHP